MGLTPGPRIGLFGGSFDPVHHAHLALARVARDHLGLDRLLWVPVGMAWQKARRLTDAEHRVAMLELAIAGESRFEVSRCELERGGPSYTVETVRELQAAETPAQWLLVIGQDQYARFDTWHGWEELLQRVTLAVAGRAGELPAPGPVLARHPHRIESLPLPAMTVSSTEVRARAAAGEPLDALVPAAVARYIAQHRLYSNN
ncbi:nicotinate-nucleotide adenylyltransferase [Aquabacterium sp. A7-Y]|uniref:nicotinate-nucleotide adenylyltransferase n=1 Tax=Aquabacterium sp. A7-Y TaxID=1349605 RepID=UPI00223D5FD7|nr:nicotinate-nucleotide adenylyltransferase [Aquabacterium sp. A7-Y]MCW7539290.1 nicotinate-nucleotide adenylyltransferase [Aquabacterium sp. A7-Y]